MTSKYFHQRLLKLALSLIASFWLAVPQAMAGVCDLPGGGSGIGGTGMPRHGSGIGGTGAALPNSGIGGTGAPQNSGIGGTGQAVQNGIGLGGTGFVLNTSGIGGTGDAVHKQGVVSGTITGFGSICVNGIEIHYGSSTPLIADGKISDPTSLAIGQVVTASVAGSGPEVIAKEINIVHAARGPVSAIDFSNGRLEVLGQVVHIPDNSAFSVPSPNIQVGDYIEVSGLRHPDGRIMASRIDVAPSRPDVSLLGKVSSVSANGFKIHGLPVKIHGAVPAQIKAGQEVLVSGQLGNQGLVADNVTAINQMQTRADIGGMISIEAYLNRDKLGAKMEMAGKAITLPDNIRKELEHLSNDDKVILTGRVDEHDRLEVEHVHVHEAFEHEDDIEKEHQRHEAGHGDDKQTRPDSSVTEHGQRNDREDRQHDSAQEHNLATDKLEHERPEQDTENKHDHDAIEQRDHDLRDYEMPDRHERNEAPDLPEYEAPELHEHDVPELPDYDVPEVEDHDVPELSDYEAPELYEHDIPELPDYDVPEVEDHDVPELPEYEAPELDNIDIPDLPDLDDHHDHDDH